MVKTLLCLGLLVGVLAGCGSVPVEQVSEDTTPTTNPEVDLDEWLDGRGLPTVTPMVWIASDLTRVIQGGLKHWDDPDLPLDPLWSTGPGWTRELCTPSPGQRWMTTAVPSPDPRLDVVLRAGSEAYDRGVLTCLAAIDAPTYSERLAGLCDAIELFLDAEVAAEEAGWTANGWRDFHRADAPPDRNDAPAMCG